MSLLAAWFRVVTAAISATALLGLGAAARLMDGGGYAAAFGSGQRDAQVMMLIDMFDNGWAIALVFFGVYNLLIGFMALRSDDVPSLLGILVILAGLGYLADNLALVGLTGYQQFGGVLEAISTVLAIVGELSLAFWLLLKGGRQQRAPRAAPVGRA